jgi:hypothetical protein
VAQALGRPVVIAIATLGEPVVSPPGAIGPEQLLDIAEFAAQAARGESAPAPELIAVAVPVRIGQHVVGIAGAGPGPDTLAVTEQRAWLEAAAAAASVTSLIGGTRDTPAEDARATLLWELQAGPAEDLAGFLARARALGVELSGGAAAICGQRGAATNGFAARELAAEHGALLAETPGGRVLGLSPAGAGGHDAAAIAGQLRALGMTVAVSARRRDPASAAGTAPDSGRRARRSARDLPPADRRPAARPHRARPAPREHHRHFGRLRQSA